MPNLSEVILKNENDNKLVTIGSNTLYLGQDNVLYFELNGDIGEKEALALKEACVCVEEKLITNVGVLVDINNSAKTSQEAKKIFKEMAEMKRVDKVVLIGLHPVTRVLASFFIGFTKNKKMRFYRTKEEALLWLKE